MGKHVHEHVKLDVDATNLADKEELSEEEQLAELIRGLVDEDVDVEVTTETINITEQETDNE